jgi:uncharacterized RDD family membrane protein YckC
MQAVSLWDESRARVATPEQVELRLEVANVGSRGLALLVDGMLRYGFVLLIYIALVLAREATGWGVLFEWSRQGLMILFFTLVFGSEWLYFTVFEWVWNGQTPGKRWMRLRVIKQDGSPVGALEVLARNLTRPLDSAGPMALIGLLFIFLHPRSQRLGDLLAQTMVVREPKVDWSLFDLPEEVMGVGALPKIILTPLELELMQRYRHRAQGLSAEVKARVAGELRRSLEDRAKGSGLENFTGDAEAWVEALARRI